MSEKRAAPVFVDDSGRRARRVRTAARTLTWAGGIAAFVFLLSIVAEPQVSPDWPVPDEPEEQPASLQP